MSRGKKIDTWKFWHESDHIEFEIRMYSDKYGSSTVKFVASNSEFEYRKESTDLNQLRTQVGNDVKTFERFKYEPKLVVELESNQTFFNQDSDWVPDGTMLTELDQDENDLHWGIFNERIVLEVRRMLIGETNTRSVLDNEKNLVYKFGPRDTAQRYHRSNGIDDEGTMTAELDDTPENREALQRIMTGIRKLREQLQHLLHPSTLEVTLKAINAAGGVKFLPAGDPKPVEKTVEKKPRRRRR